MPSNYRIATLIAQSAQSSPYELADLDERSIVAYLEDGLGKAQMKGYVYEMYSGSCPRIMLSGRYSGNLLPGSFLTFFGSISPTGISGFVTLDGGNAEQVFTMWAK
jgi:hypothetical protein